VKFFVDRCAGRRLAEWLRRQGHDVREARELSPDPGDASLLRPMKDVGFTDESLERFPIKSGRRSTLSLRAKRSNLGRGRARPHEIASSRDALLAMTSIFSS
jgi:hypothetical protein